MKLNQYLICIFFTIIFFISSTINSQDSWIRTNPGGGGATSMMTATADGRILSGSDLSGVYISTADGSSWSVIGYEQGLTQTHIFSLAPHYSIASVFLIGTGEGIFKTVDGGASVYEANIEVVDGLGYVEAIELAPSDGQIGYASHHEWWNPTLSLLKTEDGGDNWSVISANGLPEQASIVKLLVAETDPNLIYAMTGLSRYNCSEPWLYKSSDGGENWTRIATGLGDILDFDLHPTDNNIIYASTFLANDCGEPIWRYVMGEPSTGEIYKSTNGGVDFGKIGEDTGFISVGSNPDHISVTNFLFPIDYNVSPSVYNSRMGTWKTENGGTNWLQTGNLADWKHGWPVKNYGYTSSFYGLTKSITKDRINPEMVYGSYGGYAWLSQDGGDNFTNIATEEVSPGKFLSTGMDNINGNSIDVSDVNPNTIYAGYYDLGFWYSRDHGDSWTFSIPDYEDFPDHVWGIGGGSNANFVLNDPEREEVVWATFGAANHSTNGAIFKSMEFGEDWQWSNSGLDSLGNNTHGMSIDLNSPVNNRTLYVTQDGDVYKSIDDGSSWTLSLSNGGLKFIAVDHFDSGLVYAGGENGLWRSIDSGVSWMEVGLAEMRFTPQFENSIMLDDIVPTYNNPWSDPPVDSWNGVFEIMTDPNNNNTVLVSVYGLGKGLYKSIDGGESWVKLYTNDWLRGIAINPNNSDMLYISSGSAYHSGGYKSGSEGVLFSDNGGTSWTSINHDMSWPFAGRMEVEKGENQHLWAWSPGTGIQYIPIAEVSNIVSNKTQANIEIYPNPFSDRIIVDGDFEDCTIRVMNIMGQVISSYDHSSSPFLIHLNSEILGIYLVSITDNNLGENEVFKIVKK